MSDDLKTLVAQEVAKQLAAIAADQTTKKVLDFLASPPVVSATDSRALTVNDLNRVYLLTSPPDSTLSIELTLPTAAECAGKSVSFINIGIVGSQITIKATNGEHIYGGMNTDPSFSTLTLATSCGLTLVTDGYNWIANSGIARAVIVETWRSGTEWYRVWSDGFIEQGGVVPEGSGHQNFNKTFVKPFTTADYTITASGEYSAGGLDNRVQPDSATQFTYSHGFTNAPMRFFACGY